MGLKSRRSLEHHDSDRLGVSMLIRSRVLGPSLLLSAAIASFGALTHSASADTPAANVTAKRLVKANSEPGQWMTYGGTYSEQRFSQLNQINSNNVATLGLA